MTDRADAVFEIAEQLARVLSHLSEKYPDDVVQQSFMFAAACSMGNRWQKLVLGMSDDQKTEAVRSLMVGFNKHALKTAVRLGVPTGNYIVETDEFVPHNPEGN